MVWDLLELRSISRNCSGKRHLANTHKASEGTPGNFDLLKLENKTAQGFPKFGFGPPLRRATTPNMINTEQKNKRQTFTRSADKQSKPSWARCTQLRAVPDPSSSQPLIPTHPARQQPNSTCVSLSWKIDHFLVCGGWLHLIVSAVDNLGEKVTRDWLIWNYCVTQKEQKWATLSPAQLP